MSISQAQYLTEKLYTDTEKISFRLLPEKCEIDNPDLPGQNFKTDRDGVSKLLQNLNTQIKKNNVFLCVAVDPKGGRICVDVDGAPLPSWADKVAAIICSRGEDNHHIWIKLKDPLTGEKHSKFVKELLKRSGSTDTQSHDETRFFRLPDYVYRKTGQPEPGYEIVFTSDLITTPARILKIIKSEKSPLEKDDNFMDTINEALENENFDHEAKKETTIRDYIFRIFNKKPILSEAEGRSQNLFFVGLDCHAWGVELDTAIELGRKINNEKHDPPEKDSVVIHQIKSAFKYRKGPFGSRIMEAKGDLKKLRVEKNLHEHLVRAREILNDWSYVLNAEWFVNSIRNLELTSQQQINNYIAYSVGHSFKITTLLKEVAVKVYDKADFRPDILEDSWETGSISYVNLYVPYNRPEPEGNPDAVKVFQEHLKFMTNDDIEYEALLNFFAFICQFPGKKLKWAPLIISRHHGMGKNLFTILLEKMVGEQYVSAIVSDDLLSPNNDYVLKKLVIVADEVETGNQNTMKKLNPLITETKFRYVAKYSRSFEASNFAKFLFFSNKVDALKLDKFDRRIFPIVLEKIPMPQKYYSDLAYHFTENSGDIIEFLESVDLKKFNPHERPPLSNSKKLVIQQNTTELEDFLNEALENDEGVFLNPYFTTQEVQEYVYFHAAETTKKYAGLKAIGEFLIKNKFILHDVYIPDPETKKRKHLRYWFNGTPVQFKEHLKDIKKNHKIKQLAEKDVSSAFQ